MLSYGLLGSGRKKVHELNALILYLFETSNFPQRGKINFEHGIDNPGFSWYLLGKMESTMLFTVLYADNLYASFP